jgi:dihydrofolate reductase
MKLSLIVAMDRNGLIGRDGGLPWPRIAEDMRLFRELTTGKGKEVIVGRKTWETLPKLPGRDVAVLSRTLEIYQGCGMWDVYEYPERARYELTIEAGEGMVAGGAATYAAFRDLVSEAHVTLIDGEYEGDTYFPFPLLDSPEWEPAAGPRVLTAGVAYHHLRRAR